MAMTGSRDNDTPVQPQSERDKYLAVRSRRRQWGQPKSRDPAGGERPVELIRCQPFDECPQRFGVSGTNGISLHKQWDTSDNPDQGEGAGKTSEYAFAALAFFRRPVFVAKEKADKDGQFFPFDV